MAESRSKPMAEAVAEATRATERRRKGGRGAGRPSDVFGGELRRRDVFPLLVLHLVSREPTFGNRLIEDIEEITQGVITVNPNTMYPLLRDLEARGLVAGEWEHPERRSRRFYALTQEGAAERERLRADVAPRLEAVVLAVARLRDELS